MKKNKIIISTFFILFLVFSGYIGLFFLKTEDRFDYENSKILRDLVFPKESSGWQIWNSTVGKPPQVAISADGNYMVAGGDKVYLFNKSSTTPKTPMWEYDSGTDIYLVAISADGNYIVAGDISKFYLFHKSDPNPVWDYSISWVNSLAISSDGTYIAVADLYNFYLFNNTISSPMWNYTVEGEGNLAVKVSISSDGKFIAGGSGYGDYADARVYLFNNSFSTSKTPIWDYATNEFVQSLAISSDGNYIAAGATGEVFPDWQHHFYLFTRTSSTPLWVYQTQHGTGDVSISSDGTYIAAEYSDTVYLFNNSVSGSKKPMWEYNTGSWDISVAISSDGFFIAAGVVANKVHLLNMTSSTPMWNFSTGNSVESVAISSNGSYIAAGCDDNKAYLFYNELNPPGEFLLDSDASTPDYDGSFNLYWSESESADSYSIFSHDSYITEINDTVELIAEDIKTTSYPIYGLYSGVYYYKAVAFNRNGNTSSNCIQIVVDRNPGAFSLFSDDAETPDLDGNYFLNWTESENADNYSLYVSNTYITEIDGGVNSIEEGLTNHSYPISVDTGDYYYIAIAFNETGFIFSNCLYIKVRIPPDPFNLTTNAETPYDTDGAFNLFWSDSQNANNYTIYQHNGYISEINSSLIALEIGWIEKYIPITGYEDGVYYFIVVAFNKGGNRTSTNCIRVEVQIEPQKEKENFWEMLLREGIIIPIVGAIVGGTIGIFVKVFYSRMKKKKKLRELKNN